MKKSLIDIIFASEKRKNVLLMLLDGEKEMNLILDSLNTTRQALLPQMRILEDHCLIYKSGDSYGLTTIGTIIADEMRPFLEKIEILDNNRSYLATHNIECIPKNIFKRINELKKCKVIEPDLVNTYEVNKDFLEHARISGSLFFVFTFIHPTFPSLVSEFINKNINISIVITKELLDKLKSEWYEDFNRLMSSKNVKFYVYCKDLKISSLAVSDNCFVLRLLFKNNTFSSKQLFCRNCEAHK